MCRTFEESLFTGIATTLTALIFISYNKPAYTWIGAFIFTIGLTQYIDAYVWYNSLEKSQDVIRYGIPVVLALEPIVTYCGLVYTLGFRFPLLYEILMGIFSFYIVFSTIPFFWYPDLFIRILAIMIITLTFIYSFRKKAFGANWCHYANVFSIVTLLKLLF